MSEQRNEYDRKDLKIMAYKEKLATLEEENADLRVELTVASSQLEGLAQRVAELEGSESPSENDVQTEEA